MRARWHAPIDAFEQHRQLCRCQRYATARGLGPDEAPAFESLAEQQQALAIEPQHLEDVAAPAAEDEDVATERVLAQRGLHHRGQTIEALAHVGVSGHDPHPRVRWQADHARSAASTVVSCAAST